MIQSVGYTDDGRVFVNIRIDQEDNHGTIVLTVTPEFAKRVSKNLIEAAEEAEKR